jgi:hypothetical protein
MIMKEKHRPRCAGSESKIEAKCLGAPGCYICWRHSTERYLITRLLPAYVNVFSGTVTHPGSSTACRKDTVHRPRSLIGDVNAGELFIFALLTDTFICGEAGRQSPTHVTTIADRNKSP